jgi:hypothetical protein
MIKLLQKIFPNFDNHFLVLSLYSQISHLQLTTCDDGRFPVVQYICFIRVVISNLNVNTNVEVVIMSITLDAIKMYCRIQTNWFAKVHIRAADYV